jgi:outer membrane protein assembly factor BamB
VVAFFGSEGLYCYDPDGELLWSKTLGYLNSAFFAYPQAQWGFGSSPVIFKKRVVVQCDVMENSFVAAFDVETGAEIWRTARKDVPSWCTPTIASVQGKDQVLVNGWHHRGAYNFETGKEIWRMDGGGDIPIPTPVVAHGMAFFSSAHGRLAPIYAIALEARGDITLAEGESTNKHVIWSTPRQGTYMPTPLVLRDHLYVLGTSGVLACYVAKTGEELYRERLGGQRDAYTASPVAAGGKLYCVSESGTTHIVEAGPKYQHLASNELNEPVLASPAIAGRMLILRSNKALYGITEP